MKIIHVVNIQCRFIFVNLWYPQKYFNMNLFQHEHSAITIVHVLLISHMNINLKLPLFNYVMYYSYIVQIILHCRSLVDLVDHV